MSDEAAAEVAQSPATPPLSERIRSRNAAAVAGVVYSVLALWALALLNRFPSLTLDDDQLTAWFEDASHRGSLILALNLSAVSSVAFLWFLAVIRRRLGAREDRFFATVFYGSGIAYVVVWLVASATAAAPAVALTLFDNGEVSRSSATLATGMAGSMLLVVAPRIQAVFVLSTSTVVLRSEILPRWLAFLGYAVGLALFVTPLVTEPLGVAFPLWVLVVSLVMLFGPER